MQIGIGRKENNSETRVVRCGNNFVIKLSKDLVPAELAIAAREVGHFPSANGSR
jgi:hypothetical protein